MKPDVWYLLFAFLQSDGQVGPNHLQATGHPLHPDHHYLDFDDEDLDFDDDDNDDDWKQG